jgi:hypothetical protein
MTTRVVDLRLRGRRAALVWGAIVADLAFVFAVTIVVLPFADPNPVGLGWGPILSISMTASLGEVGALGWLLGLFGLVALSLSVGIAILHYRLYGIDWIIWPRGAGR